MPSSQFSYMGSGFLGDAIIRNILLSVVLIHTAPHPRESLGSKGRYTGWAHLVDPREPGDRTLCLERERERTLEKHIHTQKHPTPAQVTALPVASHRVPMTSLTSNPQRIHSYFLQCLSGRFPSLSDKERFTFRQRPPGARVEGGLACIMTTVGGAPAEICSPSDSDINSSSLPGLWLRDTPILTFLAGGDFNKMV